MCCSCVFVFALLFVCYVLCFSTSHWIEHGLGFPSVTCLLCLWVCVFPIDWVNITWIYMDVHNHIVIFTYIHTVTIYYIHVVIQYIDIDIQWYTWLHLFIHMTYRYTIYIYTYSIIYIYMHTFVYDMYVLVVDLSLLGVMTCAGKLLPQFLETDRLNALELYMLLFLAAGFFILGV